MNEMRGESNETLRGAHLRGGDDQQRAEHVVRELERSSGRKLEGTRIVVGPQVPAAVRQAFERAGAKVQAHESLGPAILGPDGRPVTPPKPARTCGACGACCATIGVRSVPRPDGVVADKPPHSMCSQRTAGGCAIHATRPGACAAFRCDWLDGQGDLGDRPDRSGLVIDAEPRGGVVLAREVFRGAFDRKRVKARLRDLHAAGIVVRLVPYKGRKLPQGMKL